jgi:Bacterial alpha-L-rhamnosidase 6 hairpin glycosidase domain
MYKIIVVVFIGITSIMTHKLPAQEALTLPQAVKWLEQEAHRIIRASSITMKDGGAAFPPQVGLGYRGFWIRDYAYTLEGSIDSYSDEELKYACRLFVKSMRKDGCGVDRVNYDGTPIYNPGGRGQMGKNPVADGSQFTVDVAWHTYRKTRDKVLLGEIIDELIRTMNAVPRNPKTELVHIDPAVDWDRCPYGFTDTVRMQGDVLFCSLLYEQACHQLANLLEEVDRRTDARSWRSTGQKVAKSIRSVFWDSEMGLFRAATVQCKEHHIWGSAFAVYLGVADADQALAVANYFKENYSGIVQKGQIRHNPKGVYWEHAGRRDRYQNGAYWATPTGWFVYTLDLVDPQLADQTVIDMVADFQKHRACEWFFGDVHKMPDYLASPSLPLVGIRAMLKRRSNME